MKFTELVDSGASKTKQHEYLVDGEQTATLKGLSFSAFARMCMIDELVKED